MICGLCKHCVMRYDRHDDEVFACTHSEGRGCDDAGDEACEMFESDDDYIDEADVRIEMCLNCEKPECNNCLGNKVEYMHKGWKEWQNKYLIEHCDEPHSKLEKVLGKSTKCITMQKRKLGLIKRHPKTFTPDEDEYLMNHTIDESANKLGRTKSAIVSRRWWIRRKLNG